MPVHSTTGGNLIRKVEIKKYQETWTKREKGGKRREKQFNLFMCVWMVLTVSPLYAGGEQFFGPLSFYEDIAV